MMVDNSTESFAEPSDCRRCLLWIVLAMFFTGCSTIGDYLPGEPERPTVKIGKPYTILGETYYPLKSSQGFVQEGIASWYGEQFHNRPTANGELFDMYSITAAHKTLPLPTWVRVTNLDNRRSMVLRINDRGPFVDDRVIDLSYAAAQVLGVEKVGTARVRIEALERDDQKEMESKYKVKRYVAKGNDKERKRGRSISRPMVSDEPIVSTAPKVNIAGGAVPKLKRAEKISTNSTNKTRFDDNWPTGGAYVQVGAFNDFGNAKKLAARLATVGKTRVRSKKIGPKTFYRVMVGPFTSKVRADDAVNRLKNMGISSVNLVDL